MFCALLFRSVNRTFNFRQTSTSSRSNALALSVHFCHPDLGMKDYEILTRGSAFLLSVDPLMDEEEESKERYGYLSDIREARKSKLRKQSDFRYEPAGGPARPVQELGWLEFAPSNFRPLVHVVGASHVLAPWLWPDYYPQPWLKSIRQEHCTYSLEVYNIDDSCIHPEAGAKFALNPFVIHYPNTELDLAIIHLKEEESSLQLLQDQGVEIMHLRDDLKHEKPFQKGDTVYFEGFEIIEENNIDGMTAEAVNLLDVVEVDELIKKANNKKKNRDGNDDNRVFVPYSDTGVLLSASEARFLAQTSQRPLPEGICGGPTIDEDGRVCGIVEGIVPKTHENTKLAGAASFIPSFRIYQFLEQYAERLMLETILPADVFDSVVELKETGKLGGDHLHPDSIEKEYNKTMRALYDHHSEEEYHAIRKTIKRERDEVAHIMETQGGDMNDIVAQVRLRTLEKRKEVFDKYQEQLLRKDDIDDDGTIIAHIKPKNEGPKSSE